MGTGCKKVCRACGYSFTALERAGFLGFPEFLRKSCLDGEYGAEVKAFVERHPNCEVQTAHVFTRCTKCGSFQNQTRLRILISPEDYDEKLDKSLRKLKSGSYVFYHRERCEECDGRLVKVDPCSIEICPRCGSINNWEFIVTNWD